MNNSCESSGQVEQSPKTPKGRKLVQGRLPFAAVDNKSKSANVANKNCEDEPKKEKLELSINSESEDKDFEEDCLMSIPNDDQSVLSTSINLNSSLDKETPKKTEQARKKREEKLKEKELREKKKAEEKALKEQQKKEKEEEKKKREELKEMEKKRKEEEKKKKEEEKEADRRRKEEERKKKEEEKEAEKKRKDEEKKRKEEEKENEKKRKEEEERRKKERLSQVFSNFFTQKKSTPAKSEIKGEAVTLAFPPFQVKDNMKLAPLVRTEFDIQRREELDSVLNNKLELSSSISLMNLKSGRKAGATWPLARESEMDNEVEVIEEEEEEGLSNKQNVIRVIPSNCKRVRAKLLQFCENRRPAYWGTWGKKSETVKPRRPFGKDAVFDYEIDSDDEWEEVEPGESLTDNEDEDKEPVDDYEVDNDFLVPHGYLSEEEGENDEDEKPLSPSAAKEQLKIKEEQFERELKEKTHHIKPSLIGCCWSECLDEEPHLLKVLKRYAAVIVSEHNIVSLALNDLGDDDAPNLEDVRSDNKVSRRPINDDDIPVLLKILHGSTYSKVTIVKEFLTYLKQSKADDTKNVPSKAKILSKIAEIASWGKCSEPGPMSGRVCWLVHAEILQRYHLQDLSVVNNWEFSTDIKKRGRTKTDDSKLEEETPPTKTPRMSLIRKFADAVVPMQSPNKEEEEAIKTTESKTSETNPNSSTPAPKAKKRIALISLPTSASKKIKSEVKSTPLTNFLKKVTTKENPELKPLETDDATDMDGIECLD